MDFALILDVVVVSILLISAVVAFLRGFVREVLTILKTDFDLKSIPVVILTASKVHEDMVRSEQLEVDAYMTKPVDMDKFLVVVKELKSCWLADVILPSV